MKQRQLLGIGGSFILFLGVFTPIVSIPFGGALTYFNNGQGDGTIILGLALVSFVLAATKRYAGLWVTGLLSAGLLAFTFGDFLRVFGDARVQMELDLEGNPFRGLADIAMQSVQLQWGWALLAIGVVALLAAAAMQDRDASGD